MPDPIRPGQDELDQRQEQAIARLSSVVHEGVRRWFRADVRHLERIPSGAALVVGNHNAGLLTPETLLLWTAVYREHGLEAVPYALTADAVVAVPAMRDAMASLGVVRATPANASRLLARGAKVLVYPGGDYEAMRPYRDRDRIVFGGRRGYIRTAVRDGVPVVPVVAAGAHATFIVLDDGRWLARLLGVDKLLRLKVFPITLCLPWGLVVGPGLVYLPWPTRILMEVLDPIQFDLVGEEAAADEAYVEACAERVEGAMQAALTRLAGQRAERRSIGGRVRAWRSSHGVA